MGRIVQRRDVDRLLFGELGVADVNHRAAANADRTMVLARTPCDLGRVPVMSDVCAGHVTLGNVVIIPSADAPFWRSSRSVGRSAFGSSR